MSDREGNQLVEIQNVSLADLKPNPRNPRTHSAGQILQIKNSIGTFGYVVPMVVDESMVILLGHGRYAAAKQIGLKKIDVVVARGLSPAKKRALALAENKISSNGGWDRQLLAIEIPELSELLQLEALDISITGFPTAEIDLLCADFEDPSSEPQDEINPEWLVGQAVSKRGDLWLLGNHRLLCGDARAPEDLARLMNGRLANMAFLDPPYNVRVNGVVGRGKIKHREFAMASGEMPAPQYAAFLKNSQRAAAAHSIDGAVHFICMDWRHLADLMEAAKDVYGTALNVVVWVKSNAGQGSFYRSQHEFIGVFRVGSQQHQNNIELGRHGRNRSNVWQYAGVNTFRKGRLEDLKAHPTVKPIALIADAIKDCTCRGAIILDTFCGSGTTILAAERTGRHAYANELEPHFVDTAIRRWQAFSRIDAKHAETGLTFNEMSTPSK